jgi:hypothetical protein
LAEIVVELPQAPSEPAAFAVREEGESRTAATIPWLDLLGLEERPGLGQIAEEMEIAAINPTGSIRIHLSWPSPVPNPILAWGAKCISGDETKVRARRVLFVGCGHQEARGLAECSVRRAYAKRAWIPDPMVLISVTRDAMQTAFLPNRLHAGAPDAFSLKDLVPVLHVSTIAGKPPWRDRWDEYLASARHFIDRSHRGKYGYRWEHYGDSDNCSPFGFLIPRSSTGTRRTMEVAALPGCIDLVVLDLSAKWMGPGYVHGSLTDAVLDVVSGFHRKPLPPFLVLVSDPRSALAAMRVVGDLIDNEIVAGPRTLSRSFRRGMPDGSAPRTTPRDPVRLIVHAASTAEAEVIEKLFELSSDLKEGHPKTSDALKDAASALGAMARTTRPPLAEGQSVEIVSSFMDNEVAVREALREEGDTPKRTAIGTTLLAGREAASRLLRETPARIALHEARQAAATGVRVVFVTERSDDAVAAGSDAPTNFLVVGRQCACGEISTYKPDLLFLTCRAMDVARILSEVPASPREIRIVLSPDEVAIAASIASLALSWPEMSEVKERCRALLNAMPPKFARIMSFDNALDSCRRSSSQGGAVSYRSRVEYAHAEVIAIFDDLEDAVPFAPGAVVVVLNDGEPCVKRATALEAGDLVVLPPEEVSEKIAREMGWAGEQELLDDCVRRYKRAVAAWREGPGAGISIETIIRRMRAFDPQMPVPSSSTVRYWLSAAEDEQEPTPRASGKRQWFAAFCEVIGHRDLDASDLARHFDEQRGRLRRDGHVRRCLVERFLFDRYDLQIHKHIPSERVAILRGMALAHVRTVRALEKGGIWEEDT